MFNRLFAFNSIFNATRPSVLRFSLRESKVYFWPLMNRQSFSETRAYSHLRTLSKASLR
jgi:hypothetical protein